MSNAPSNVLSHSTVGLENAVTEDIQPPPLDKDTQQSVEMQSERDSFASENENAKGSISFPTMSAENFQDDNYSSLSGTTEPFAQGLIQFLTPVIQEMDGQIDSVKTSQIELQKVIEKLLNELQMFVDTNHPPFILPSVQKLVNARKRLTNVNSTLKQVQDRLDRLLT
ncbi:hypothetical protein K493DRAFT_334931, partial [Basidiobolus meristosporus CBS 931.73]